MQIQLYTQDMSQCFVTICIQNRLYSILLLSILEYGGVSVCLLVRKTTGKPLSCCPISILRTYSESSWPCRSFKTIWGTRDVPNRAAQFFFSRNAAKGGGFSNGAPNVPQIGAVGGAHPEVQGKRCQRRLLRECITDSIRSTFYYSRDS